MKIKVKRIRIIDVIRIKNALIMGRKWIKD